MIDALTGQGRGWKRVGARAVGAGLKVSLRFSPRPMALFLRAAFAENGRSFGAALAAKAPLDIVAVLDVPYGSGPDEVLDVYVPAAAAGAGEQLPTVLWTHGGAWLGGSKEEIGGYLRMIADAGFTVVAPRYSLAPSSTYPTPVRQVMAAWGHVQADAERLHVDPSRLVLVGDSAGAQISSQLAAMATNPAYAALVGITPTIEPEQLRGVGLFCGVYDLTALPPVSELRDFVTTVGWAYSGRRGFRDDEAFLEEVSVPRHVTDLFPPTFATAGNADPLEGQTRALAAALRARGVAVEELLFAEDHEPPLGHEYQFDLDLADARTALERLLDFLRRTTAPTAPAGAPGVP